MNTTQLRARNIRRRPRAIAAIRPSLAKTVGPAVIVSGLLASFISLILSGLL